MNLGGVLLGRASGMPHVPAIVEPCRGGEREVTFAELGGLSAAAAGALRGAGIGLGDRVLVLVPMSIELYAAVAAVLRVGAVVMLVDPSAGLGHVERCCAMASPAGLIATGRSRALCVAGRGLRGIRMKFFAGRSRVRSREWRPLQGSPDAAVAPVGADDPALLTFTSGSTGEPRAAIRSHGLLLAQQWALQGALGLQAGSRTIATLPVFVLSNLAAGVTSILADADLRAPGRIRPGPLLAQIDRHQAASIVASPALLARLCEGCERTARVMHSVRWVFTGGGPVFWHVLDRLGRAAPAARVVCLYGSTEAEPIAEVGRDAMTEEHRRATGGGRGLLAGVPVPEVRLRILEDRWGEPVGRMTIEELDRRTLASGLIGEVVVAGPHVLGGYLDGRGDVESKFRVGGEVWHRTGDSGWVDASGRLWLTGRCVGRVSDARGVMYPLQVEAAVHEVVDVARAAFLRCGGERVVVVQASRSRAPEVETVLRGSLGWAFIDRVVCVRRIPVDPRHNSKIDYPALVRLVGRM